MSTSTLPGCERIVSQDATDRPRNESAPLAVIRRALYPAQARQERVKSDPLLASSGCQTKARNATCPPSPTRLPAGAPGRFTSAPRAGLRRTWTMQPSAEIPGQTALSPRGYRRAMVDDELTTLLAEQISYYRSGAGVSRRHSPRLGRRGGRGSSGRFRASRRRA